MDAKNVDTVIEVLAETVRRLKTDLYLKEMENERLKEQLELGDRAVMAEDKNGKL